MKAIACRLRLPADETTTGGLLVFAAEAGFGTLAIFGKLAAAAGLSTSTLLLFRFVVATITVWAVFGFRGRAQLLSGRALWIALAIGTMYGVMNGLFFEGLAYLSAGLTAIVFYTYPVHVFVLATVALDERVTRLKMLALGVAVAGVGLIAGANPTGTDLFGIGLVLLAAVAYAIYTTGIRATLSSVDAGALTATALIATTLSILPYGVLTGGLSVPVGIEQWLIVFGIGLIGTAAPIVLFFRGLDRIEASHASIIGTSEPMATVLLGVALLGETITPIIIAGGALVLVGVVLIQRESRRAETVTQ